MIKTYTGKTGSGKTYLMIKDAYKYWKHGVDIYSNTVLNFKEKPNRKRPYGKIRYFEHINEVIDIQNGLVLFDEAQVLFNARNWESLPDEFQYKLQQHRKHDIDLICTTQNMGTIDITYRRLVHHWIHCKNIFQLGRSPRILIGLFIKQWKDVDMLWNTVDDLTVPTVRWRPLLIYFFSRKLYDTMYDIGFRRFKTLWLSSYDARMKPKQMYLILPKKMTMTQALREIKQMDNLMKLRKISYSKG